MIYDPSAAVMGTAVLQPPVPASVMPKNSRIAHHAARGLAAGGGGDATDNAETEGGGGEGQAGRDGG